MIFTTPIEKICDKRHHGIYYTPPELAKFLSEPLITEPALTVFDPAYGGGALLLAAEKISKKKFDIPSVGITLFGCDRKPVNGLLKHLPTSNLTEQDFFSFSHTDKFDVILMNPPYVRHHLIGAEKIRLLQEQTSNQCVLNYTSDLWAYFLVKSIRHLRTGGSIGAILPWSFLQADYACSLRSWLVEIFGEIKVLTLGARYFDSAKERVILLWLNDYRTPCHSIKIAFSKHIDENIPYFDLDQHEWKSDKVILSKTYNIESLLSRYVNEFGFSKFIKCADIKIGVVTGADEHFIASKSKAEELNLSEDHLIPIFTTSREFAGLFFNSNRPLKRLVAITEQDSKNFEDFIRVGEEKQFHLRSHSLRRKPWYAVNIGKTPDAFFPYRMLKIPYLVTNDNEAQCTNSIHRVYFKNLSPNEIKWVQISLLSAVGQLALESFSKTYGRSMLKIEPKSLKNAIVYINDDPDIDSIYYRISDLLASNHKVEAMKMATAFINEKLQIPDELSNSTMNALIEMQNRRFNR